MQCRCDPSLNDPIFGPASSCDAWRCRNDYLASELSWPSAGDKAKESLNGKSARLETQILIRAALLRILRTELNKP